jgi:hypothetical protein
MPSEQIAADRLLSNKMTSNQMSVHEMSNDYRPDVLRQNVCY